jgi:hypothetical protein
MPSSIEIPVEFDERSSVFFRQDQEREWIVVGYIVKGNQVKYLVSTPEVGEVEAYDFELTETREYM